MQKANFFPVWKYVKSTIKIFLLEWKFTFQCFVGVVFLPSQCIKTGEGMFCHVSKTRNILIWTLLKWIAVLWTLCTDFQVLLFSKCQQTGFSCSRHINNINNKSFFYTVQFPRPAQSCSQQQLVSSVQSLVLCRRGTWRMIQQRSSSSLFCRRSLWAVLVCAGMSTLWCCLCSISFSNHSVTHPPRAVKSVMVCDMHETMQVSVSQGTWNWSLPLISGHSALMLFVLLIMILLFSVLTSIQVYWWGLELQSAPLLLLIWSMSLANCRLHMSLPPMEMDVWWSWSVSSVIFSRNKLNRMVESKHPWQTLTVVLKNFPSWLFKRTALLEFSCSAWMA